MIIFAQETDLMTAASIIQILAQLGAIGLLGILVWQIPKIIRELKEWRRESEQAHREEREQLKEERKELAATFREEIKTERDHCEKHFTTLTDINISNQHTTHQVLDKLGDAVKEVSDAVKDLTESGEHKK